MKFSKRWFNGHSKILCIGELGSLTRGAGVSKSDLQTSGLPAIRYGELYTSHDIVIQHIESFIDEESSLKSKKITCGDILFASSGETQEEIGKSVVYLGEDDAYAGGDLIVLSQDKIDPVFLAYLLNSQEVRKQLFRFSQGSSVVHVYSKNIADIQIPYFCKQEQSEIASVLLTCDKAIQTTESLIERKQELKRGLMHELLTGKRRFPSFGEPAIKGGTVPEGWQETALGNIADIRYSNVDKKTAKDELPIRQCNYMDVWKNEYIFDNMAFMQVTASDREISKFQLQVGDVLLTKDSEVPEEIASTALVVTASDDLVLGYHLALIRPDSTNAIGAFISAQLEVPVFKKQLVRAACGATRFGLGIEWLKKAKVWIPGIEEQTAIADLNFKLLREIEHLQSLTSQLREQKRGLMQMLFSGELDLSKLKSIATKVPA